MYGKNSNREMSVPKWSGVTKRAIVERRVMFTMDNGAQVEKNDGNKEHLG